MNVCPNCGNHAEDGARFCNVCGTSLSGAVATEEPVQPSVQEPAPMQLICGNCGAANPAHAQSCGVCGVSFLPAEAVSTGAPAANPMETAKEIGGKVAGTAKELGGKAAVGLKKLTKTVKAAVPKNLGEKTKSIPKKVWMIGGGVLAALIVLIIVLSALGGGSNADYSYALYVNEDSQLSYVKLTGKGDPAELTEDGTSFSSAMMAEDGKTLFYLDRDEDGDTCLYYRNAANTKKEPVLLESNVSSFTITADGSRVYFTKKGNLYVHNLKKSEKIVSDVDTFVLSEDEKSVLYADDDGELSIWNGKKSTQVDSDVENVFHYSDDFKTIYYLKDDNLYLKSGSKDGEKILSDCTSCYITEDGTGYAMDDDDELYYVDGKKLTSVASDVTSRSTAYERAVLAYEVEDEDWYVAVKSKSYELDVDDVSKIRLSSDGKQLHLLLDVDDDHGDLVSISIGSKPGKVKDVDSEVYTYDMGYYDGAFYYFKEVDEQHGTFVYNGKEVDTDVYYDSYGFLDGKPYYMKDVADGEGTLYLKGTEVAEDVCVSSVRGNSEKGTLLFITEWDTAEYVGTLNAYKSKISVIAEEVYYSSSDYGSRDFFVMPEGEVLYFTDYDLEDYEGVLNCYNGSKSVELADDAKYYIPVYSAG